MPALTQAALGLVARVGGPAGPPLRPFVPGGLPVYTGFTIPNVPSGASAQQTAQSQVDSVDVQIVAQGASGIGVLSGCLVIADGTDTQLYVQTGQIITAVGGLPVTINAGYVSVNADPTNPCFWLVTATAAGSLQSLQGTPAGNPTFPTLPIGQVVLASVYVAAGAMEIDSGDVVDKRMMLNLVSGIGTTALNGGVLVADSTKPGGIGIATRGVSLLGQQFAQTAAPSNANVDFIVGGRIADNANSSPISLQILGVSQLTGNNPTKLLAIQPQANLTATAGSWTIADINAQVVSLGAGTLATWTGINLVMQQNTGGSSTTTLAKGLSIQMSYQAVSANGIITTGIGIDVSSTFSFSVAPQTFVAFRYTSIGTSTVANWGIQIGNVNSYHQGKLTLGSGTNTPTASLDLQATAGNEVMRISDGNATVGNGPIRQLFQYRVTTTDATQTTLATIAVPASTTLHVIAHVVARRTGGSAGTAEDGAGYMIVGTYKNVAGTATIIGAINALITQESVAGYDATFTLSGGNLLLRVTGVLNTNITWHATVEVYAAST